MNEGEAVSDQQYQTSIYQFNIISPERNVLVGSNLATFDLCTIATELFGDCGDYEANNSFEGTS